MAKRRTMTLAGVTMKIGDAKEHATKILHAWPLHEILVGWEFNFMHDVFGYHPGHPELQGEIEAIRVGLTTHHSGNTHRAFHIKRFDDEGFTTRPSYLKCFRPSKDTHLQQVTAAMRTAIQPCVDAVRRDHCRANPGVKPNEIHVHHDPPFADARDEWLLLCPLDRIEVAKDEQSKTYRLISFSQLESWIEFHDGFCTLQAMTAEEHSKHHYGKYPKKLPLKDSAH